jgi:UbiD family decarboxylase
VVVDEDIDPANLQEVMWAVAEASKELQDETRAKWKHLL